MLEPGTIGNGESERLIGQQRGAIPGKGSGHVIVRDQVPEGSLHVSQRERRRDPGLNPTSLDAPNSPTDVAIRTPIIPFLEIKTSIPCPVQFGPKISTNLDPRQKIGEPILRLLQFRVTGGYCCLVQTNESKVHR